jgi:hypothetical protein
MTNQARVTTSVSGVSRRRKAFDRKEYERRHRPPSQRPSLSYPEILAWADAHHACTGKWPTVRSGRVRENEGENWNAISAALHEGYRGLPGGFTLTQFLAATRCARNPKRPPRLKLRQILEWADAHRARHGTWPSRKSGAIPNSGGESWAGVDIALSRGTRGLWGGSSLRRLLTQRHGESILFPRKHERKWSISQILLWADEYFARLGRWPGSRSGRVPKHGATWKQINLALIQGRRGLPGGSSLARLVEEHRGRMSPVALS